MKVFKKWRDKNGYHLCSGPFQRGIEEGWRAALKEVLKKMSKLDAKENIINWIEKELKNG